MSQVKLITEKPSLKPDITLALPVANILFDLDINSGACDWTSKTLYLEGPTAGLLLSCCFFNIK